MRDKATIAVLGLVLMGCAASASDGGPTAGNGATGGNASGGGGGTSGRANDAAVGGSAGAAAPSFGVTSMSPQTGWMSGGDYITMQGGGFADGLRVFLGDGRAPVRVVSPTEAVILTPP